MCVMRKLFVFYVLLVLMEDLSVYEDATWCCVNVLTNGSANYTLNTAGCRVNIWNLHETSIKDEEGSIKKGFVLSSGPNWILLNREYSEINSRCMDDDDEGSTVRCTDLCKPGEEDHSVTGAPDLNDPSYSNISKFVVLIIIIIVIIVTVTVSIIIWRTGCYRRCSGDTANRHEANNHANDGGVSVEIEQSENFNL